MPLYYFVCQSCNKEVKKLLTLEQSKQEMVCECGGKLKRQLKAPTTRVVEVLDNGRTNKKIERLSEAERLYHERSQNDPRNKKDSL